MTPRMTAFRQTTTGDLDAIVELWVESSKYHEGIDPRLAVRSDSRKHLLAFYSKLISDKRNYLAVALTNDYIIGYICIQIRENPPIHFEKESGFVDGLFVRSDYRRQGIGSSLYRMGLNWLKEKKIQIVRLSVSSNNMSGLAFWKDMGFSELMYIMHAQI